MNAYIRSYYKSFRNAGYPAHHALHAARAKDSFEDLENDGNVRLVCQEEEENYYDVYGVPDDPKEKEQQDRFLELWGCYYVGAEVLDHTTGRWIPADGVGMCVYNHPTDPEDNWYVADIMAAAVEMHGELLEKCS